MSVPGKDAPSLYFVVWCLTKNPRHFSNHKKGRSSCSDEDRQAETLACGLAWLNKVVQTRDLSSRFVSATSFEEIVIVIANSGI